jgi:hypothetical protein
MLRFAISWSLNSHATTILYRWKFRSLCKILLALWSDIPRAKDCLVVECLGLLMSDCLTASLFCGVHTLHTLHDGFFCTTEALVLKYSTHNFMIVLQRIFQWWTILKYLQNIHFTLKKESPLTVMVWFSVGTLTDERTCLFSVHAAGPCQRILSRVRVP